MDCESTCSFNLNILNYCTNALQYFQVQYFNAIIWQLYLHLFSFCMCNLLVIRETVLSCFWNMANYTVEHWYHQGKHSQNPGGYQNSWMLESPRYVFHTYSMSCIVLSGHRTRPEVQVHEPPPSPQNTFPMWLEATSSSQTQLQLGRCSEVEVGLGDGHSLLSTSDIFWTQPEVVSSLSGGLLWLGLGIHG